jgi:hypothetical protein
MFYMSVMSTWRSVHSTDLVRCPYSIFWMDDCPGGENPVEVWLSNWLCWGTFFMLGLQFTHADVGPMKSFSLSPSSIKEWGKEQWLLLCAIIVVISAFSVVVITLAIEEHIGRYMLSLSIIITIGLITVSVVYGSDH